MGALLSTLLSFSPSSSSIRMRMPKSAGIRHHGADTVSSSSASTSRATRDSDTDDDVVTDDDSGSCLDDDEEYEEDPRLVFLVMSDMVKEGGISPTQDGVTRHTSNPDDPSSTRRTTTSQSEEDCCEEGRSELDDDEEEEMAGPTLEFVGDQEKKAMKTILPTAMTSADVHCSGKEEHNTMDYLVLQSTDNVVVDGLLQQHTQGDDDREEELARAASIVVHQNTAVLPAFSSPHFLRKTTNLGNLTPSLAKRVLLEREERKNSPIPLIDVPYSCIARILLFTTSTEIFFNVSTRLCSGLLKYIHEEHPECARNVQFLLKDPIGLRARKKEKKKFVRILQLCTPKAGTVFLDSSSGDSSSDGMEDTRSRRRRKKSALPPDLTPFQRYRNMRFLNSFPNLEELELIGQERLRDRDLVLSLRRAGILEGLKSLTLHHCDVFDGVETFRAIGTTLLCLRLYACDAIDDSALGPLVSLQELQISHCRNLSLAAVSETTPLMRLSVDEGLFWDKCDAETLERIGGRLKFLSLSWCGGVRCWAEVTKKLRDVSSLVIVEGVSWSFLQDDDLCSLATNSLISLRLVSCGEILGSGITPQRGSLTQLHLWHIPRISDEVFPDLCHLKDVEIVDCPLVTGHSLQSLPRLRRLLIGQSATFRDEMFGLAEDGQESFQSLRSLEIVECCEITGECFSWLSPCCEEEERKEGEEQEEEKEGEKAVIDASLLRQQQEPRYLTNLRVEGCPRFELDPEASDGWLWGVTWLELKNCESFTGRRVLRRLWSLAFLDVERCPGLERSDVFRLLRREVRVHVSANGIIEE